MQWDVDVPADLPRLAQLGIPGIEPGDPPEDAGAG
jgi:hypothetical protein